tara:strand:+ start:10667 stop:11131 length:465 start_codon:yes stop_codon:yes gene_type:complete
MRLILALLISISFPTTAQVYKWTDENGNTHFGAQPPPGKRQQIDIRESSPGAMGSDRQYGKSESDIIRQSRELETRKREQALESAEARYRERVGEIRSDYQNRPDYVCTGANNRLQSAKDDWQNQKRQGYSVSDQQYHEQRIRDLERRRDNLCR